MSIIPDLVAIDAKVSWYKDNVQSHLIGVLCFCIPAASINWRIGFYLASALLLFYALFYLLLNRVIRPLNKHERYFLLALVAYPAWVAVDMNWRGQWDWGDFQEVFRLLFTIPLFLFLREVRFSVNYLYWGILLGAAGAALWAFYQFIILDYSRTYGGTNNVISAFAIISLILSLYSLIVALCWWHTARVAALLGVLACLCGLYACITSGSRGAWMVLPVLGWLAVELLGKPNLSKRLIAFGLLGGMAILTYILVPAVQQRADIVLPAIYQFFVNGELLDGSVGGRLELWKAAWIIFQENWLIGTGVESFYAEKNDLIAAGLVSSQVAHLTGAHNQLFESLAEMGIFGPVLVYAIYGTFIALCWTYYQSNRNLSMAGIFLAVGFMAFGMAEGAWIRNNLGVFYAAMSAIIAAMLSWESSTNSAGTTR